MQKSNAKLRASSIPRGARFAIRAPRKVSEGTLQKKSSRRPTKRWQSGPEWKWKGRFAADPKKSLGFGLKSGRPRPLLKHLVLHTCVSNCPVFAIFGHAKWQTDDRARANIAWINLPMKYKMWENARLFQALINLQHTCLNII